MDTQILAVYSAHPTYIAIVPTFVPGFSIKAEPVGFLDSGGRRAKSDHGSVGRLVAANATASDCVFHPRSRTDEDPGVVDFRPITLDRQPCWPYHNDSSQVVQSQGRTSDRGAAILSSMGASRSSARVRAARPGKSTKINSLK